MPLREESTGRVHGSHLSPPGGPRGTSSRDFYPSLECYKWAWTLSWPILCCVIFKNCSLQGQNLLHVPKYPSRGSCLACGRSCSPPSHQGGREEQSEQDTTAHSACQAGEVTQTLEEHDVQEGSSDSDTTSPFPTINELFQNS